MLILIAFIVYIWIIHIKYVIEKKLQLLYVASLKLYCSCNKCTLFTLCEHLLSKLILAENAL